MLYIEIETLTAAQLKQELSYAPQTGIFRLLKDRPWKQTGAIAGRVYKNGYRLISVFGTAYLAHRLAWLYMTGKWPPAQIDHRNMDRDDNRWANLRLATASQNKGNRRKPANNTSGYKGVTYLSKSGKWVAQIGHRRKTYYLGRFNSPKQAHAAYCAEAKRLFGEFARD